MQYGIIKVAVATPPVRVGDCIGNAQACAAIAVTAAAAGVRVLTFPELCLTGATCGDLFTQECLLRGAAEALLSYAAATADCDMISVVGLPVAYADRVFNCAAVVAGGSVLGLVPKSRLSAEERRRFSSAPAENLTYDGLGDGSFIPLGIRQLFVCTTMPALRLGVELGNDLMATVPPSARLSSAGATIIARLGASPETVGAEDFRRLAVVGQSARCLVGYLSAEAGEGESTTDHVFGGHALIAEGGHLLAERMPFSAASSVLTVTELDVERLIHDRRMTDFDTAANGDLTENYFTLTPTDTDLTHSVDPYPFIPADTAERARRCERILDIQAAGLKQRVTAAWAKKLVVGISGGLDSTLALLVMARAMDALARPRTDIIAVTMPCFGTTVRTKTNATVLCEELGVDFRCVDIFDAVNGHFRDIGHDPARRDVVYENAQARERTQVLMDIANEVGGMVIGTGDLSELALGWATYNGDHMSMYGVNGGVPKTLIRHVVSYVADTERARGHVALADALNDILHTPVSPELLPADESGEIAQRTEDLVGPYELHDFYLYHMLRYGTRPRKLFRLSQAAFGDRYDDATRLYWLETFTRRFFSQQFKRSCLPDGPAVGTVGVSPRTSLQMPSDASSALWMAEIAALKREFL